MKSTKIDGKNLWVWPLEIFGGFDTWGYPFIAGWFIMENPSINGWFGGTPISGNHHLGMQENICNKHDGNSQLGISNKPSVLGNIGNIPINWLYHSVIYRSYTHDKME